MSFERVLTLTAATSYPRSMMPALLQTLSEENVMRKLGHTITTIRSSIRSPLQRPAPAAAWTAEEGGALSDGDATFAQKSFWTRTSSTVAYQGDRGAALDDNAFELEDYILTRVWQGTSPMPRRTHSSTAPVSVSPLGLFADNRRLVSVAADNAYCRTHRAMTSSPSSMR